MSAIPVGLTSNLYGEKIRPKSARRVASPSNIHTLIIFNNNKKVYLFFKHVFLLLYLKVPESTYVYLVLTYLSRCSSNMIQIKNENC